MPNNEKSIEAELFLNEFLIQLQQKASEMNHGEMNYRFMESAENLRQLYSHNPTELYDRLYTCLKFEENLVRNPEIFAKNEQNEGGQIAMALANAILTTRAIETENCNLKDEFEMFCRNYNETTEFIAQYDSSMATQKLAFKTQVDEAIRDKNENLQNIWVNLSQKKIIHIEKMRSVIIEVNEIQKILIENYLFEWTMNQKMHAKGGMYFFDYLTLTPYFITICLSISLLNLI